MMKGTFLGTQTSPNRSIFPLVPCWWLTKKPWNKFQGPYSEQNCYLVGGFNTFEQYARQIGSLPQGSGVNIKNAWNHQLDIVWVVPLLSNNIWPLAHHNDPFCRWYLFPLNNPDNYWEGLTKHKLLGCPGTEVDGSKVNGSVGDVTLIYSS